MLSLKLGFDEGEVISLDESHVAKEARKLDFILVEFDAIDVLHIESQDVVGFILKNVANGEVEPVRCMQVGGARGRKCWGMGERSMC
jgi:hypothetical protein